MKMPLSPKPFKELLAGPAMDAVGRLVSQQLVDTKYLHWDELRHRTPPAGSSHEEWWLALKFMRLSGMRHVPLADKSGKPFTFSVPDVVVEQLHQIDRGAGSLLSVTEPITNPQTRDRYLARSLIEEAITSSQLEGAVTTRQVAKEMLSTGRKPRDRSERMILNNFLTMKRIIELKDKPLSPTLVLDIHRSVTLEALDKPDAAGRLRRTDEPVHVVDIEGTVFYTPPDAGELPGRLEAMCQFANGKTPEFFIHPVVRAIILHFWLAYDHPFVDGNGRTARALFYWAMLHAGYWLFEFISISQVLLKAPVQYAMAFLHTETDANDLTYFLIHQTEVIRRSIKELHDYIGRKTRELGEVGHLLDEIESLNHRQRALLAHALRHPGSRYTVAEHRGRHGVAYDTARTDLLDLAEAGLVEKRKSGKEWVFVAPRNLPDILRKRGRPQNTGGH
ncbi:MAG: Fic family protein [Verrucomicrobia bacterium]|nr:Fic family protein [Verrucomicrobiota bacterium]